MVTPVIRVFSGNVSQVETVLRASIEVTGQLDATLVLMHDVDFDPVDIAKVASLAFTTVRLVPQSPVPADLKWPSPQNLIWQQAARWADANRSTLARSPGWLWWESDASPLAANWLAILSAAYKAGRKLFAGVPCHHGTETYMNGVGIYPFNIVDTLQDCSALYCRQLPFDIAAAPCVMRSFTDLSHLIVHVRKPRGGTMQRLTQPRLDSLRLKYPQAVFLHGHSGRSGDASGDLKSSEVKSTTPPPPTVPPITLQTKWPCGLFTFPPAPTLTAYFNPSLIRYNNKRWLFTRRQQFDGEPGSFEHNHSDLTIFELRDNNTLALPMLVPQVPNRYPFEQWEDPRAMVGSDGRVYTSHSTWVHYKPWSIRQALCRLSTDWTSLEVIQEPRYGGNTPLPSEGTRHEKNWTFFEHDSRWWFVYTINPHVVVPVAGKRTPEPYANPPLKLNWSHGDPRGGTPPVLVDSDYVCFFHSAVDWITPKRRYYMGAYTFSARPPFNVTRITTEPLLIGSELDFRSLNGPPCVFPNGALFEAGHWTVVFGVNDEGSGWIRIPHKDLLKRLSPV